MSGLFLFGLAATAVDFRDSDRTIFIRNHDHVTSNFNTFEVRNSSSNVELTNIVIQALGTTSKGRWVTTDNATVILTTCTFVDMNTFGFESNADVLSCKFLRCGQITCNTAEMTGSVIDESTVAADASALVWNVNTDPDGYLDNMSFTKGTNAHHAIELGASSPITVTLRGWTTSGFNASNGQNDSTIYTADRGSDTTWTINIIGGTGNFSYKKARAGDTINVVINPVQITIETVDSDNDPIANVRCSIYKVSDDTELMNEDSNVSGIATETISYPGTPYDIYWRVRESPDGGGDRYKPDSGVGEVNADGFSQTVRLKPETVK